MEVLKNDESNIFAAMGVAIILAEHNKTDEALEILKAIKEACPSHVERPSILINLAHINIVNENYESAINLYLKAIELFPRGRGDLDTELYLAKAYYKNKQFEHSQKILKKLIILYPTDLRVRFDLAICLYDHASTIFNQTTRKVSETQLAKTNLQHTKKLMDYFLCKREPLQHLPSNASQELQQAHNEQYMEMRSHCESLQNELGQSIHAADEYIEFDREEEVKLMNQEKEKAQKVTSLQMEHERVRLEREMKERQREEQEQLIAEEAALQAQEKLDKITEELRVNMMKQPKKAPGEKGMGSQDSEDGFVADDGGERSGHGGDDLS